MTSVALVSPFREEGELLVYVAEGVDPSHDTDWWFDEVGKRAQRNILIDVRLNSTVKHGFRTVVYKRHHELDAKRVAVVGVGRFQEFLVNFLISATGHSGARFFHDETSARAWLGEDRHA